VRLRVGIVNNRQELNTRIPGLLCARVILIEAGKVHSKEDEHINVEVPLRLPLSFGAKVLWTNQEHREVEDLFEHTAFHFNVIDDVFFLH
jgi:hypothetical protein